MLWYRHITHLIVFLYSLALSTAHAADLRLVKSCPEGSCDSAYLYIIGKIEVGDAARVTEILKKHGPGIQGLTLRSPGGSMYDSIQIGTMAQDLMLDTFAPYRDRQCGEWEDHRWGIRGAPCTCVSGCFLIWLGGVHRYGVIVGMHRPWDTSRKMGTLSYDQAAPMYAKWLADLKEYLLKMEIPEAYFSKFIATVSSGEMKMLKGEEVMELLNHPTKDEWLTNRCGHWPSHDNNELGELNWQKFQGQPYNQARLQRLIDRYSAIVTCKGNAQRDARVAAFKKMFGM